MPRKKVSKAGRPKLKKGEGKEVTRTFKCSPEESKAYDEMAKAGGLDFSKWARQTLNKAVKK